MAPLVDGTALAPIGGRVDASDDAEVTVQTADLTIVKTASPLVGFTTTDFTYTIVVTNPATETAVLVPVTTRDAVIDDTLCSPATYDSGDTNDDSRMEPGESWTYLCTTSFASAGVHHNVATATMPVEGVGSTLEEVSRRLIEATLAECGSKRKAADMLGISLKTLYNRLAAYKANEPAEEEEAAGKSAYEDRRRAA